MPSSDRTDLKRIRDNQRRSRARRRQYIQELEVQIESYRTRGIEVTAEIQRAAQRVAEQNKKMRALLNSLSFSNERISYFLRTGNLNLGPVETTPGIDLLCDHEGAAAALELLLTPHRPTSLDSGSYVTASSTPRAVADNSAHNGIASLLPEIPTVEPAEQVQLSSNLTFPVPSTCGFSIRGISHTSLSRMLPSELAPHPPALVEPSDEKQPTKDFQYDGSLTYQCDTPYGYDLSDEDTMSYSSLSFSPESTGSVSAGSMASYNSRIQSYEQLEYASTVPCADGDIRDDAISFDISPNSGGRVPVWA
ncbi:hypothetical protein F4820DRAFT_469074 [Hypoxylon rubiginosum]|uniref:Uncharacterized protein n=1 Tax=Hypoxylon rubiginosum TaxID=110542 RepID=A0ACB9Z5L0_9PEZI|nr:hypothetical protein F4820DRAFT_469074 [Hypoxylon rubiginosum]